MYTITIVSPSGTVWNWTTSLEDASTGYRALQAALGDPTDYQSTLGLRVGRHRAD